MNCSITVGRASPISMNLNDLYRVFPGGKKLVGAGRACSNPLVVFLTLPGFLQIGS